MALVYAVTEAAALAPDPPLYLVACGPLAAVVADREAPAPAPDALRAYDDVVRGLGGGAPLLPMRFGSQTDDVAGFLAGHRQELLAALERVRGAVEIGARCGEAEPPAGSGTDYLRRRARDERAHGELAALARAAVRLGRPHVGTYLVDADDADAFRAAVAERGLVATGPWPPYSFAAP